jgi:hypothetical protein
LLVQIFNDESSTTIKKKNITKNVNIKKTIPSSLYCSNSTPFSNIVFYQEKVFVVAEVDDTYVYHIHLGFFFYFFFYNSFLIAMNK